MHAFLSITFATVIGIAAFVAVLIVALKESDFLGDQFWKILFGSALLGVGMPLLIGWNNPLGISFEDVVLVRRAYPGLSYVLVAYAVFAGVAIGGLLAKLIRALRAKSGG